ncbi:MAG TPA: hydrogenase maturation protease [Acidobacteriota bacterium]|nr:hydrogenase maturation protease [Acidobacteriota bacterium]
MTAGETAIQAARTVVLGIGNVLLGDEGVGVRVVEELERAGGCPGAELVDGGTAGLELLAFFDGAGLVVIVDAAADGAPPGTVNVSAPAFAADHPPARTPHEIGLKGILDALALADERPEIVLVTVSVVEAERASLELSPAVARAVPEAASRVRGLLSGRRGTSTSR